MGNSEIDWSNVKRILVVKLRSIGDTVLATPSLIALRRFVPNAQIDILLEDWVAPLIEGHDAIDNVISVGKSSPERLKVAQQLRRQNYDVAFNLHGGTTATFFTAASRAKHRVGFADYQYSFLYNHLLSSASDFWKSEFTHSAEQQLALIGFVGVPVEDRPKTRLVVNEKVAAQVRTACVSGRNEAKGFALIHPASAFVTKQWPTESFAKTAEFLVAKSLNVFAVAGKNETAILDKLKKLSNVPITTFNDLSLPEITALASQAKIFVGNDSGIAHIVAAVGTPSVVVFGSSNRNHWRPWTDAPSDIVYEEFACQPCPGYECKEFGEPKCILSVRPKAVFSALSRLLS
ncbi:MAG TPA: glycosyltransferase family 9 protein [Pyrinomonadaceae bacterium]|nr:glycosyltransferase family 9 protein [Acidobacteriota bacterium]HQZ95184.1 glycosyltransferase family 9 protein [Pyrinomonadaceae bacterium]